VGRQRNTRRPRSAPPWTIGRLIQSGARRFRAHHLVFGHGMATASDEAEHLTLHALKLPAVHEVSPARRVSRSEAALVQAFFRRRILERKPAAYLTREAWLAGVRFYVDERVIVPRSYIAELLRENLAPWITKPEGVRRALDLCTGSGCLAVLLARSFPDAVIEATDISRDALDVARRNASLHRLSRRIHLLHSDLFAALGRRRYDLIVANPPYVSAATMSRLPPEHRAEPALALAGGADGLDLVHRILHGAWRRLRPGGLLVVEVGHNRARVERAYPKAAFTWAETSGGDDCVLLLTREQLHSSALTRAEAPRAARARPRRRAGTSARA
jgi:ribosomal protein L3 glutamine methyltransferase